MRRPPIRIFDAKGSYESIGYAHGSLYAEEIQEYTQDRVQLVAGGSWSGGPIAKGDIIDLAESMIPAHQRFDEDLFSELSALAEGAEISVAEAIIVGGTAQFSRHALAQFQRVRHRGSVVGFGLHPGQPRLEARRQCVLR